MTNYKDTLDEQDNKPDIKLVRALQADFKELYVKEFTANWKTERFMRNIELGVMSLDNVERLIEDAERAARLEQVEQDSLTAMLEFDVDESEILKWRNDRITELSQPKDTHE